MLTLNKEQINKVKTLAKKIKLNDLYSYKNSLRFFNNADKLLVEFTDGFTLSRVNLGESQDIESFSIVFNTKEQINIFISILTNGDEITFTPNDEQNVVVVGDEIIKASFKLFSNYPDTQKVIPKKQETLTVVFNPDLLIDIAKRVNLKKGKGIVLEINKDDSLTKPIIVKVANDDESFNLLMPMRL